MIKQIDMMRVIQEHRGDAVVIPVFRATPRWRELSSHPELDLPVGGAMGKASSFALGLALARPDKRVILLDGDGSLEMNLGSLITAERNGAQENTDRHKSMVLASKA